LVSLQNPNPPSVRTRRPRDLRHGEAYANVPKLAVPRTRPVERPNALTAPAIYRNLVKSQLSPGLRELGFKGSGNRFELPSTAYWVVLGLQGSLANEAHRMRFTVNLSVVSKQVWADEVADHPYLPQRPGPMGQVRGPGSASQRLGYLDPATDEDMWWIISVDRSNDDVMDDVLGRVDTYAVPWLRSHMR
jgi:hypothetical protein